MPGHVLILVAMAAEGHAFAAALEDVREREEAGLVLVEGRLAATSVTVARTGIGKVAAARACGRLLAGRSSDLVVVAGVAGALAADLPLGALVVAEQAVQHDLDARPLTDAPGVVPGLGVASLRSDPAATAALRAAAERAVASGRAPVARAGAVASGDAIIRSEDAHQRILREFPGALAVDMETAAVAHACRLEGVPWAALRLVSDGADEHVDTEQIIGTAGRTSALLADTVVGGISAL